jgi:L-threonylcarbamoyladenylate synthase
MPAVNWAELVSAVRQGAVASFPTDTVPALAAAPIAATQIYTLKQRQPDKPLILMAGEIDQLWDYLVGSPAEQAIWRSLMAQYWPGALTLVLPASDRVPLAMNPLQPGSVGVRVPDHPLAREILRQTGPMATTSANLTGEPALLEMAAIGEAFPTVVQLNTQALAAFDLPNPIRIASGTPSTVVKWQPANPSQSSHPSQSGQWQVLRQGAVILPGSIHQP